MNIPKTVKVAGFTYKVFRHNGPFVNGAEAVDGLHDFANQEITVSNTGSKDYQEMVFLHEVMHAILDAYTPDGQNEKLVEQLSKGLYQLIKDNPEIFSEP